MKRTLTTILLVLATTVTFAQEKNIKVVELQSGKSFSDLLGSDKYEIDSLVVVSKSKHFTVEDFGVLRDCCEKGRLTGIDMSGCRFVDDDRIPSYAFYPKLANGMPENEAVGSEEDGYRINLRHITLPHSITVIGDYAFASTNLESVGIPLRVKTIGDGAFNDCGYMKDVVIYGKGIRPESDGYAFKGITADAVLHVVPGNSSGYIGSDGWTAFSRVEENDAIYRVMDINLDGSGKLADILGLDNMCVDSITLSGTAVREDFECLELNGRLGRLQSLDLSDCVISGDGCFLYACDMDYLRLPRNMQTITDGLLEKAKIKHLIMPESYEEIGVGTFVRFRWFADSTLVVAEGCRKINYQAFYTCNSIKTLVLPSTLEELEPGSLPNFFGGERIEMDLYINRMEPPRCLTTYDGHEVRGMYGPFACDYINEDYCMTKNWRLFVPVGAKKNYENAEHWNHFDTIIEIPLLTGTSTGIGGAVSAAQPDNIKEVYTSDGRFVSRGASIPNMPKGLYIVKENGTVRKVITVR